MYMLTCHCNKFWKVKFKKNYNLSPLLFLKLSPWMDHMDVPWMVSQEWLGQPCHNYRVYDESPQQSEQQKL